ncbi:MAG: TIGR01212 family radical SAM protein [Muribaculaceae bacterium]|nr:TIGR01212 family radical SAM protein [Muribaculaceae bacterium]
MTPVYGPGRMPDDFAAFLRRYFPGKMQKLSVDGGFTCPNRDGTIGRGGCVYCNNESFSPGYCRSTPLVTEQIEAGKRFFARKYPDMRYLAYFQSYTGTHAPADRLRSLYEEALECEGVDGLIVGTRPDCMPADVLGLLKELSGDKFIMVEYGAETSHDVTLRRINRCHEWTDTVCAVERTRDAGIPVGLHFILGLPGEDEEMMLRTVERINALPVDVVKFHQLQVIRGTVLHRRIVDGAEKVKHYTVDEYIDLCSRIAASLRSDIVVERFVSQAPDALLVSPRWGLKNHEFTQRLRRRITGTIR